jgi:hypothetical protein
MAHDVFISYSTKDKATADAVCATLEARGIRCWIAPRDILPGMDWGESLIDAIEASRVMMLIFSAHANESPQVKREVERAVNKGVAVIPLRIEDVRMSKSLEYFISTPHWLDALTPPMEQHLAHVAETVGILLERLRGPQVGAPAVAVQSPSGKPPPLPPGSPAPEVSAPPPASPPPPAAPPPNPGPAQQNFAHNQSARPPSMPPLPPPPLPRRTGFWTNWPTHMPTPPELWKTNQALAIVLIVIAAIIVLGCCGVLSSINQHPYYR